MEFISGLNNYVDFSLLGHQVYVRTKHDIIDATIKIESDGHIIFSQSITLEKSINYWFRPIVNIYVSKSLNVLIYDKNGLLMDNHLFNNLSFYFGFNLVINQFTVEHDGKIKTRIKIEELTEKKIICETDADFTLGDRFWHLSAYELSKMGKVKISVYDMFNNLLIDRLIDLSEVNYVFCHIPKNAGTSILTHLKSNAGHNIVDKSKVNLFVCAFVRNPYDRFLSCFYFLRQGGLSSIDLADSDKYIGNSDIADFIKNKLLLASQNQIHFRPQSYWIPNGADFIGRYENLQQDFDKMMDLVNLPKQILPVTNKSKKDNHILTNQEKEIIYQVYKEDFERFGYSK